VCRGEGARLAVDRLRYLSHWITPLGAPRRYDTRFFLAIAPQGQAAGHDDAEIVASQWVVPSEALDRNREGALDLMFPTIKHLESLSGFSGTSELWAAAPAEVATIQPRINVEGPDVRILLPGDPGFEDASGLPDDVPFPDRPIWVRDD